MKPERILCGRTILEPEDLIESNIDYPVELEYFKTGKIETGSTIYGIEIVKIEHLENEILKETRKIDYFSINEKIVDTVLDLLQKHKVTPMGLKETVFEIVKSGAL